jgi:cell division transport system permease protein
MNWAAVSTLTLMLFLLGVSYLLSLELTYLLRSIGSVLELTAYLKPEIDPRSVQSQILQWQGIESVRLESKEEAWQAFLADLGQLAPETNALLEQNPFLDSLKIAAKDQSLVPSLGEQLAQLPAVDSVWYGQDLILQLQQLNQGLSQMSLVSLVILTTIALVVTYTTIRLVNLARATEIEIMGLVGASPTWIYSPILMQGMGFGIFAVLLAGFLLRVCALLAGQLLDSWDLPLPGFDLGIFPLFFTFFGISVPTIGSWLSLQAKTVQSN